MVDAGVRSGLLCFGIGGEPSQQYYHSKTLGVKPKLAFKICDYLGERVKVPLAPELDPDVNTALLARQAIFDPQGEVYAYELLYRASLNATSAVIVDGDQACRQTIVSTVCDIGLETLVGKTKAFVNLSEDVILSGHMSVLPPSQAVIEVLESVESTAAVRAALEQCRAQGFSIALDDFELKGPSAGLLDFADIIKVDVLNKSDEEVASMVERLRNQTGAKLLAEKVETRREHQVYLDLGFDLFQGFYLCRPQMVAKGRVPRYRTSVLELLAALEDESLSMQEMERFVQRDASLSYKLLRLLNSAMMGVRRPIDSIGQAIVLIGQKRLKRWATLIALAGFDDAPDELLSLALIRARMCEILAEHSGASNTEPHFTVGLFSALDAMSGLPMQQLVEQVPLAKEVRDALVDRAGTLGSLVCGVLEYERGDWQGTCGHGFSMDALASSYLDAVRWADETRRLL